MSEISNKQVRAERSRRLIQIGTLAEKYLQLENISVDEISGELQKFHNAQGRIIQRKI